MFFGDEGACSTIVRKALRPEAVRRARYPKWVLEAIKAAVKAKRLPQSPLPLRSAEQAFYFALESLGGSWEDHAGKIEWDSHDLLVSEPYVDRFNLKAHQEIDAFAKLVGGAYMFSTNSEHFPGRTIRIIVAETPAILCSYRNYAFVRSLKIEESMVLPDGMKGRQRIARSRSKS